MFQKCPICNGSGRVSPFNSINSSVICDVCKGKKIISTLNGIPPDEIKITVSEPVIDVSELIRMHDVDNNAIHKSNLPQKRS